MTTTIINSREQYETALQGEPGKQTVVDFWATWCGPCRFLSPILDELEQEGKIDLVKVDVDQNPELAQEHGIMSIPTMMFYKDGERNNDSMVGAVAKNDLVAYLKL